MAITPIAGIAHIEIIALALDELARFYCETLDCVETRRGAEEDGSSTRTLKLGDQTIVLRRPAQFGRPCPQDVPGWNTAFQHFAIIVSDMDAAMTRLRQATRWSSISRGGPQRLPASSGGVSAFKFRDLENHPLEFLAFPPGGAPEQWRRQSPDVLFLGVDHSAISVADTERSAKFYSRFGFETKSQTLNKGPEQERLDDIDNAIVEVTGLATAEATPPHLELLCYRDASAQRISAPLASNDGAATRLVFATKGGGRDALSLQQDPDGHWLVAPSEPGL